MYLKNKEDVETLVALFNIVLLLDRESNQGLKRAGNIRTVKRSFIRGDSNLWRKTASHALAFGFVSPFTISLCISVFPTKGKEWGCTSGGKRIGQDREEEEHTQSVLLVTKELSLSGSLSVSGVQSWNVSKTILKNTVTIWTRSWEKGSRRQIRYF